MNDGSEQSVIQMGGGGPLEDLCWHMGTEWHAAGPECNPCRSRVLTSSIDVPRYGAVRATTSRRPREGPGRPWLDGKPEVARL